MEQERWWRRVYWVRVACLIGVIATGTLSWWVVDQSQELQQLRWSSIDLRVSSAHESKQSREEQLRWLEREEELRAELAESLERLATLRHQFIALQRALHDVDTSDLLTRAWPPIPHKIEAKVVAIRQESAPTLVVLSAGSDDGVQPGDEFVIYRGNWFVAKVAAKRVFRDWTEAWVRFTGLDISIESGDSATTRLD